MERELHIGDVVYVDYRNNRKPERAVVVKEELGHFFASHADSSAIQLDVTACMESTAPCDPRILFPEDVEGWRHGESVEDVVAEMRRFAKRHWMHDEGQNIGIFAGRIEKAAGRIGNTARLRNELLNCKTLLASLAMQSGEWRNAANNAVLDIQAALDAPSRNCDRFACFEDALEVWRRLPPTETRFHDWFFAPARSAAKPKAESEVQR